MATTKSSAKTKSSSAKGPVPAAGSVAAKTKTVAKTKAAVKPVAAPKAKPASKAVAAPKPARPRAKKPAGIPFEQRRNYIEMAAYYIAERRGFAPGNPMEDWVQAEAEIDRLLAEGRLGG